MQDILDSPRDQLTPETVAYLLQTCRNIEVSYGARRLDTDLTPLDDISGYLTAGSSIQSDTTARVHRSCELHVDNSSPINPASDLIQPYMTISSPDTGEAATFNLGVYTLVTPQYDNSGPASILTYTGYDLLSWVDVAVGDSLQFAKNADPVAAAKALLDTLVNVPIYMTPTSSRLAAAMSFPFDPSNDGTTYLDVINALLVSAGYDTLWVDWSGAFHMEPYVTPSAKTSEWTFDLDSEFNIVAGPRTQTQDLWNVPNVWVFVMQDLQVAPVEGTTQYTYRDDSANNPGSITNRGGRIVRKIAYLKAADYASLVVQATKAISADLKPAETFDVNTSPFPLAWHNDTITYLDDNLEPNPPALSGQRIVQATYWTLPLDGADMGWTWQTVLV